MSDYSTTPNGNGAPSANRAETNRANAQNSTGHRRVREHHGPHPLATHDPLQCGKIKKAIRSCSPGSHLHHWQI
jgi:hypothetical protein